MQEMDFGETVHTVSVIFEAINFTFQCRNSNCCINLKQFHDKSGDTTNTIFLWLPQTNFRENYQQQMYFELPQLKPQILKRPMGSSM